MRVIEGSRQVGATLRRPVVTVGNFDGLHVGHRSILATVVERARAHQGDAVVYTFEPHPRKVLRAGSAPRLLTTLEQKLELIEAAGIDAVVVEPFTAEFARTSAEEFIRDHLQQRLRPLEVYVGYDFHFGRDREGSMRSLTELGPRLGFSVTIIPEVTMEAGGVNSTRIRSLLVESAVERAASMLGRPYTVRGLVVRGEQRGRTLGFPTANLAAENEVLPGAGVYAGWLRPLDRPGSGWPAVTNVGWRPTFQRSAGVQVEAHLIGFEGDLYGQRVDLSFTRHLRAEQRFAGPGDLQQQIRRDVEQALELLGCA